MTLPDIFRAINQNHTHIKGKNNSFYKCKWKLDIDRSQVQNPKRISEYVFEQRENCQTFHEYISGPALLFLAEMALIFIYL